MFKFSMYIEGSCRFGLFVNFCGEWICAHYFNAVTHVIIWLRTFKVAPWRGEGAKRQK